MTSAIRPGDRTSLRQQNLALQAENAFLRQQFADQNDRIAELENRLKQYENPHTPSSKQGGAGNQQNSDSEQDDENEDAGSDSDAASDSSPGRNPGHEGTTQPPPDPDTTVRVGEAYCHDCGRVLTDPDEYVSRIIVDIPLPIPIEVTEYELGKQECSCGNEVLAEHPDCPETGRFGPHLLAQTALLRYHGRLPHRKQAELFDWQLDHPVSPGTIYNMTERVADRLRPAYEEIRASVRESDVIYCDETGFPVDGDQQWVWTFVTDEEVFYTIDESRGSQVLEDVLGDELAEDATLSCDGWSAYPSYHRKLQRCWAHLLREAKYVAERHEEAEVISEILHDLHEDLTAFDERDPPASARERRRAQASLCLEELVRADYESEEVTQLAEKIRNGLGCWLTFVTEPDVDSTNNRAEPALREQVVMRKVFGGLRSETGVRIHETLATMVATWEHRGLDPPDQLKSALGGTRPDSLREVSATELR
nr:IS66 family transposase [Saliphagus infecundisoli]